MMKRLLTTPVILTGLIGLAGCGGGSDFRKAWRAHQAGDYSEAVKWYRKAAEQGFPVAQSNLGLMYANGKGALPNTHDAMIEAYMWFNIAVANGYTDAARNRDIAAGKLSS
jgi:TPR repeat protein